MLDADLLTPERRDALIEKVSRFIVNRRLEAPAVFMLESSRPLTFMGSQALIVGQPVMAAFFGWERVGEYRLLLEDRENIDRLIARIDADAERRELENIPTGPAGGEPDASSTEGPAP